METVTARISVKETDESRDLEVVIYEGKYWLACRWVIERRPDYRHLGRIICLDNLSYYKTDFGQRDILKCDFIIETPMPKVILDGPVERIEQGGFLVVDDPFEWKSAQGWPSS
jgi:hypothetical protein